MRPADKDQIQRTHAAMPPVQLADLRPALHGLGAGNVQIVEVLPVPVRVS